MASSLSTTASASMVTKSAAILPHYNTHRLSTQLFRLSQKPKLRFLAKGLQPTRNGTYLVKAQLNEESKDAKPSNEPSPPSLATEESISEFISQVSSLVKLVDSRDIVELQLKQLDCELLIRKKEALPLPPSHSPVVMMHSPPPPPAPVMPAATPAASAAAPAAASSPSPSAISPSPSSKSVKSSLPPLKCPMAGTFYRSPAPGEPSFVKVGDKVQKGQVVCIIEAMKLMNEIEADQTGTIVEILAEDGKPVSVDTPLFVIEP
ncbi:PREDICTED: biotin carboxyl carrier protein of acetyl-CoA carboxylase 1, chloroplastic isoform X3 [Populus euphratica]|uniref:Biotin carboxyl carrier protein of acetyl-CoA carboxylase n=1 Tax=Populus euphratica TaxID=75702 RepID=A0AAJ6XCE9_POPEU|nr:PREDICTED: biotin carboxyl carrier protein of acetyl-CoA carboxylase 1, chloroplastic isoform X3 [Populus euphratica]